MSFRILPRKSLVLAALVTSVAVIPCLFTAPAKAGSEPYIGWDFGNGFGIGLGTPPSAYDRCATYGWPVYPYRCRNSAHSAYRHSRTTTTVHRDYGAPPPPSDTDTVHRENLEPPPPATAPPAPLP
jgi:hypothetical protein